MTSETSNPGYRLSTRPRDRKVPGRTPDTLGRNRDQERHLIFPQAARRVALGHRWVETRPGCWAPWVPPPDSERPDTCWVPLNEAGAERVCSGQGKTLSKDKKAQHVKSMTGRGVWVAHQLPNCSCGIHILMSAWGVFIDFFSANVYSQIVVPSATE